MKARQLSLILAAALAIYGCGAAGRSNPQPPIAPISTTAQLESRRGIIVSSRSTDGSAGDEEENKETRNRTGYRGRESTEDMVSRQGEFPVYQRLQSQLQKKRQLSGVEGLS